MSADASGEAVFLATTALEEFWDVSKPMVFLGESCRRFSRRHVWQPLNARVIEGPWDTQIKVSEAYTYTDGLYERWLPPLSGGLNALHGTVHNTRYWRTMIGCWLHYYINALYDRYVRLQCAFNRFPRLQTLALSSESFVTPASTLDFAQHLKSDHYNLQLYSRILTAQQIKVPSKPFPVEAQPLLGPQPLKTRLVGMVAQALSRMTQWLNKSDETLRFSNCYFSRRMQISLALRSSLKVMPVISHSLEYASRPLDETARRRLAGVPPAETPFEEVAAAMLPIDIPLCFVEGYSWVIKNSERFYGEAPAAILSATGWYFDEPFKQWAAVAGEYGSVLLGAQHGGNYGSMALMWSETNERKITDKYYTWGWESREDYPAVTVPMPAARFTGGRAPKQRTVRPDGILWVTNIIPRYLTEFPLTPERFVNCLDWQTRFVSALSPKVISQLRMRPHREDLGWDISSRIKESCPGLRIESWDLTFSDSLARSKLFVCDHAMTTYCEALAANHPTILFWDPGVEVPRPEARPYFDQLHAAGILQYSPEAAATTVAAASDDVEAWWSDPSRQKARANFCARFVRGSPDATGVWLDELMRVTALQKPGHNSG